MMILNFRNFEKFGNFNFSQEAQGAQGAQGACLFKGSFGSSLVRKEASRNIRDSKSPLGSCCTAEYSLHFRKEDSGAQYASLG
ncbi:Protein of unknown function [Pyronema omphalodes CBS 100304]|uniref:Uncharacterized protein n=1 Tax=Pyronema omphalodes (strain CBS 100304) TaxID=1076935 RepID=U4LVJ4_PYROM|nr:Protein of unknown function [Pyronema omphalodes CBS 100304]